MLNFLFNMVITVTLTKYYVCYEGMDAHVAYGFVHLHNEKPYLAEGPISNKMIYTMQQLSRFKVFEEHHLNWEQIPVPSSLSYLCLIHKN
ncbi:diacylglycerol kinase 7-like isoform X1 [Salvia splendens]|uniref:diacylglycerol kinase 7-like isoform X1 n=1 Tax=Salvia splendens TaxID=180675 RepID=UPI001C25C607|nr:diacylglycerol kinase 7-like isoform X1 [Salvia splendens]